MLSSQSTFMHLFNGGQGDALITMTGFDHANLNVLLQHYSPLYHQYTPHVASGCNIQPLPVRNNLRGCIRTISPVIALTLVLVWTWTRGSYAALQVIFGMTASNISKWLRFSKRVLLLAMLQMEEAKTKMSTIQQARVFKEVIRGKYPSLVHCWGALDGVKIGIQKPSDDMKQSHFYNGWTHDHYVVNLFLFTPDGHICAAYVNSPGTTHDSAMASMSKIYRKIDDMYDLMDGMDSAFASEARESLIKSYQTNQCRNGELRQDQRVNNDATAI
jgi:hypothetical protein